MQRKLKCSEEMATKKIMQNNITTTATNITFFVYNITDILVHGGAILLKWH